MNKNQGSIRQIFKKTLKGKNIMTPSVICYGEDPRGETVWEITQGEFMSSKLYGLTILRRNNERWEQDLEMSQSFSSLKELHNYVEEFLAW